MIERLTGIVIKQKEKSILLDVCGVGFTILTAKPNDFSVNTTTSLHTYFSWNQDRGPSLYGFAQELDLKVFELIIDCPKMGPTIALMMLEQLDSVALLEMIGRADDRALSTLKGIGPKKASELVYHMQSKALSLARTSCIDGKKIAPHMQELTQALESLGYSKQEISAALKHSGDNSQGLDQALKLALKFLSK